MNNKNSSVTGEASGRGPPPLPPNEEGCLGSVPATSGSQRHPGSGPTWRGADPAPAAVPWAQGRSRALRAGRAAPCWAAAAPAVTCPAPPAGPRAASALRSAARWETAPRLHASPQRCAPWGTGRGRSSEGLGEPGTSVPSQGRKTASGSGLAGAHERGGRGRAVRQGKSGAAEGRAEKEARGPPTRLRKSVGWGAEWTRMRGESMSVWEEEEQESSP